MLSREGTTKMYERVYGEKYALAKNKSTTEIAALIRGDVKAAIKAGTLPKGLKVSVRTAYFAGGSSIDLTVTAVPDGFPVLNPEHVKMVAANRYENGVARFTPEMTALVKALESFHDAYNHDGSHTMSDYFDVNYYGSVSVSWTLEEAARAAIAATLVPPPVVDPFEVNPALLA